MLVIKKRQRDVFKQDHVSRFEQRTVAHLARFWGDRCAAMGEEGVLGSIREGIARARTIGLRSERDIARYIDLMYILGRDFDKDARHRWVAEIFERRGHPPTMIDEIYRKLAQQGA